MKVEKKYFNIDKEGTILVSICVLAYGHEKYIRKALDSILMQEVNFKYEIIVGEDCSPDGTREILKEYEDKYKEKFVMIYRKKNVGGRRNAYDVFRRCQGKYVAILEGDDYWIDKLKLQKQVDFLEINPEYIATTHKVIVVDENCEALKEKYPEYKGHIYNMKQYKKGILPGQTGTIVRKNYYRCFDFDFSIFNNPDISPGDQMHAMIMASLGPVYCFSEKMSAYRHVTSGGTSYSSGNRKRTPQQMVIFWSALLEFSRTQTKNREMIKYLEGRQMYAAIRCFNKMSLKEILYIWIKTKYKKSSIFYVFHKLILWPISKLLNIIKRRLKGDF